ncbi:universal stress protein [Mycolicibacterium lacusdiani]|uniref:universal stress protein n=1 Tax=Mycolicibacterium lacusdiani TaxID=2895283 RepID=UPI001F25CADD|nr:universal stress protein [Mycolicibacterium lacusdiani]
MYVVARALWDSVDPADAWRRIWRTPRGRSGVVAGIDGLPGGFKAAQWAAVEAAARGIPLRLVYAVDPSEQACAAVSDPRRAERIANAALRTAEAQARKAADISIVTREVIRGPVASALTRQEAVITCIGSNGARVAHLGHRTGTATEVILKSTCPVVVVRGDPLRQGVIVARLDFEPKLAEVLSRAGAEAHLRHCALHLLPSWTTPSQQSTTPSREFGDRLQCELDRLTRRYPGLDIEVVPERDLGTYLVENRDRIALFIAPDRELHDVGTVVHPSVELAWQHLDCPVMVGA